MESDELYYVILKFILDLNIAGESGVLQISFSSDNS